MTTMHETLPEEPSTIRLQILEDVGRGEHWVARRGEPLCSVLWEHFGPKLSRQSMDEDAMVAIVHEYRREIWYWLAGDRTWSQCIEGLAGRIARRLEA